MELISSRSEQYSLMSDKQREILVRYFNDGMTSTTDTIKINKASKAADFSIQRVKVRLRYHIIYRIIGKSMLADIG